MSSKLVEDVDSDDDDADDGGTDSCQRRDIHSAFTYESELESCSCPLCHCSYANSNSLWQHIILEHVSRSRFHQNPFCVLTNGVSVQTVASPILPIEKFVHSLKALAALDVVD